MASRKVILVTGCSAGGIGAAIALALAHKGHHVFATARNPSKIPAELTQLSVVSTLELDVTSAASVEAAAKAISDATEQQGTRGLDVLVNNAGVGYTMPILDIDLERAQKVYDTNVWGSIRTIQAFADLLIAKKGRVVNVSSVGAIFNSPWISTYASSKAALASYSNTLRMELRPFGVSVITVMVGPVDTPFYSNLPALELPPASRYSTILDAIMPWSKGEIGVAGSTAEEMAESLIPDILNEGRNGQVWRGKNVPFIRFVSEWFPSFILDRLISRGTGVEELSKTVNGY